LPGVDVGSVIEYEIEWTYRDHPFFFTQEAFGGHSPAVHKSVQIRAPKDLPIQVRPSLNDVLTVTQRVEGDTAVYEWSGQDLPSVRREADAPEWVPWTYLPMVLASSGAWVDYAQALSDALGTAAAQSTAAAAKARQLVEGLDGEEARILAIRNFIASNIRGVPGYVWNIPLSTVTPPDRVLADGYGHALDRAALFAAMLRAVGVEPNFVLRSLMHEDPVLADPPIECPQPSAFSYICLRVDCDGRTIYLDGYNQYGVLGACGHHGRLGMVLPAGKLMTIELPEDQRTGWQRDVRIRLADNGDAWLDTTKMFHGASHGSMNETFSEIVPEDRRRYHQRAVAGISQSAEADGDLKTDFETYPGQTSFRVRAADYAVREDDYLYLQLPTTYAELDLPGTDRRQTPVHWVLARRESTRVTIDLPEDFTDVLLAPKEFEWIAPADNGRVVMSVAHRADPPGLVIDTDVDLKLALIDATDYPALLEIDRRLSGPGARTIILKKSAP